MQAVGSQRNGNVANIFKKLLENEVGTSSWGNVILNHVMCHVFDFIIYQYTVNQNINTYIANIQYSIITQIHCD